MAIAHVQDTTVLSGHNADPITSNAFGSSTTTGNCIVGVANTGASVPPTALTMTDNKSNTSTQDNLKIVGNGGIWQSTFLNITGGASHTITEDYTAGGTADMSIIAAEFSGVKTSGALDTTNTATGTGTSASTGSVTAAVSGSLYLAYETHGAAGTITPSGGWSQIGEQESGSNAQPMSVIYKITSGAQNGGWTIPSDTWMGGITVLAPAASAFLPVPPARSRQPIFRSSSY